MQNKVSSKYNKEKAVLTERFLKKKQIIEKYMRGAPFVRLIDKISFILGVFLLIATTYMVGRYPNDYYYAYHIVTIVTLVLVRLVNYKSKGWHYYLFDFCYYANAMMIYFIIWDPKND